MQQAAIDDRQNRVIRELNELGDWMEKYAYLVERGKRLPMMDAALKTEDHTIGGCQSRVWMTSQLNDGTVSYCMDSDAMITRGLIALLLEVLDRLAPADIVRANLYFIEKSGLGTHLSPLRANGLTSIVNHMKQAASGHLQTQQCR